MTAHLATSRFDRLAELLVRQRRGGSLSRIVARNPGRGQGNVGGSMSYVTGSHNFKVGGVWLQSYRDVYQPLPAAASYTFAGQVPESVTLHRLAARTEDADQANRTLRAGAVDARPPDAVRRPALRLRPRMEPGAGRPGRAVHCRAALRHGRQRRRTGRTSTRAWASPSTCSATGARRSRRTLADSSRSRPTAGSFLRAIPPTRSRPTRRASWTDANRDYVPQESELGPLSNANFGRPIQTTQYADEVMHGWGNRGYNWQGSVSFQHELVTGLGLSVGYFRTWYGNFFVTDNILVSAGGLRLVLHHRAERSPAAQRGRAGLRPARSSRPSSARSATS